MSKSDHTVAAQEMNYLSKNHSLELVKHLKIAEDEIEELKSYISDMSSRIAVYLPLKNNEIDKKIAARLNRFPDQQRLKIIFLRESEGVYEFGNKRVKVKVKQDRVQIKVGGGYMTTNEFLS